MFRRIIQKFKKILYHKRGHDWFHGDFASWNEAQALCTGYDSPEILEKVKNSLLQVKNGTRIYERDSVLFDKIEYSWPLTSALLWIAMQTHDRGLRVLDFGGSLGTTFFQNRKFTNPIRPLSWNIVEQDAFVKTGREYFQDEQLCFFHDIDAAIEKNNPDVLIMSSVLQFLSEPYSFLDGILKYKFPYIIIDLTGFTYSGKDRLTIEKVDPQIYPASYPCWFFNETKFLDYFRKNYRLMEDFVGFTGQVISIDGIPAAGYKGFIFKREDS